MYEIPSNSDVKKCVITKDVITGAGEPILVTVEPGEGEPQPKKQTRKRKPKTDSGETA
jgi:ATP-dependent Clp protease ATP-binding subunit ClpX